MSRVSVAGTDALMRHHRTDLVLATGSRAMVLAAYSSGKPTYAVGPGNAPAYIHASVRDIELRGALHHGGQDLRLGHGLRLRAVRDRRPLDRGRAAGGDGAPGRAVPLRRRSRTAITQLLFPQGGRGPSNVEAVSQSPATLAHLAGFSIPEGTQLLVVRPGGIGYDFPLSREILGPVFKFIEVDGPDEGIATAVAQLRFGGDGHTSAVHAGDEAIISRYAEAAPAYRVLVNTPSLFGAMGYSTGVDRTFMIGTGTIGGSISSDNIGVRHLHQPQARRGADPRLGDADERPGRPARGRLGDQPRARRRAEHDGARRGRGCCRASPPAPAPAPAAAARARPAAPGASLEELVRQAIAAVMRDA